MPNLRRAAEVPPMFRVGGSGRLLVPLLLTLGLRGRVRLHGRCGLGRDAVLEARSGGAAGHEAVGGATPAWGGTASGGTASGGTAMGGMRSRAEVLRVTAAQAARRWLARPRAGGSAAECDWGSAGMGVWWGSFPDDAFCHRLAHLPRSLLSTLAHRYRVRRVPRSSCPSSQRVPTDMVVDWGDGTQGTVTSPSDPLAYIDTRDRAPMRSSSADTWKAGISGRMRKPSTSTEANRTATTTTSPRAGQMRRNCWRSGTGAPSFGTYVACHSRAAATSS